VALFSSQANAAETPSLEEMWKQLQSQQAEIQDLKKSLAENEQRLEDARRRLEIQNSELLSTQKDLSGAEANIQSTVEMVDATADAVDSLLLTSSDVGQRTNIGGYGELHINQLDNKDQIDFHRFVLFFSHRFSDNLSFHSELELEHSIAGEGKVGEIELEQAYIQYDYSPQHRLKAGLFLIPIGLINETHEPDTFYGVERNSIEKNLIPATWWEGGLAFEGELAPGFSYDVAVHSGLDLKTDSSSASSRSSIRSGRQKVGNATADSWAATSRIRYTGVPGLRLGLALQHQQDLTQGDADNIGIGGISANLLVADMDYQRQDLGLRAVYSRWFIDDEINLLNAGADEQVGWYVEPSYRINEKLGLFIRYSEYDLTAGSGLASSSKGQWDIGLNYWLHERVVFKVDLQSQDNAGGGEVDGFNLGLGYSF